MAKKSENKMEFGMHIARQSILEEIKNGGEKNLVLSPLSIHIALNMLASGSTGRTLEQLLHFLESDGITHLNAQSSLLMELTTGDIQHNLPPPDDSVHQSPSSGRKHFVLSPGLPYPSIESGPYSPFISSPRDTLYQTRFTQNPRSGDEPYQHPNNGSGPTICLVSGIWVDKRYPLKNSFKQLVGDVYKANAQSVDFLNQAQEVTGKINSWAREASKGHIDPLFTDAISKNSILVLANALYFKGAWVDRFNPNNTRDEDFHLLNGKTVRVPFMTKKDTYNFYGSFDDFKLLKMSYKFGPLDTRRYAMYIILPHSNNGLQELVEKFNVDPRLFLENRALQHVKLNKLWLPKLKYEYELNTLKSMKELGLDLPFDAMKAEIKEMVETSEIVYVSKAIQKAHVEVNEEGTIATAVTASQRFIMAAMPCMKPPPEVNFVADHPFLFIIKEEVSGIVLFVGAALNPLA